MVDRIPSVITVGRIQTHLMRIQADMADLQDQLGSGRRARDLQGLGSDAPAAISLRALLSETATQIDNARGLDARLAVQDNALDGARGAVTMLRNEVLNALVNNQAAYLGTALENAFATFASSMNATWAGQYVFGGEAIDVQPLRVRTVPELLTTTDPFSPNARPQVALIDGAQVEVSPHAASFAPYSLEVFRSLREMIGPNGQGLPTPLSEAHQAALRNIAERLRVSHDNLAAVQARNGELRAQAERFVTRLEGREVTMKKALGERVDADATEVALAVNARQQQYEAMAQVFSKLRELSLLNFLR